MNVNDIKNLFPRFSVDTFDHVLGHVSKAAGRLHGLVGDADHIEEGCSIKRDAAFKKAEEMNGKTASVYIADLIICAAKLAALCPSGEIDLEQAVAARMAEKRDYLKQYSSQVVVERGATGIKTSTLEGPIAIDKMVVTGPGSIGIDLEDGS